LADQLSRHPHIQLALVKLSSLHPRMHYYKLLAAKASMFWRQDMPMQR
jgi:hypothetical protein